MEGGWGWWASLSGGWVGLVGQSEWRVGGAGSQSEWRVSGAGGWRVGARAAGSC